MKKTTLTEAVKILEELIGQNIPQAKLAKIIGGSQAAIGGRLNRNSELKVDDVFAFITEFPQYKTQFLNALGFAIPDAVEIAPYHNPEYEHLIKNKNVTSIWHDREITHLTWGKDENNLKYIAMPGDNMNGGVLPIRNGEPLIIDITSMDILRSGIYAYFTEAGFFVNVIQQHANKNVIFTHWNPAYKDNIYTMAELQKVGFKVIGRVIRSCDLIHD